MANGYYADQWGAVMGLCLKHIHHFPELAGLMPITSEQVLMSLKDITSSVSLCLLFEAKMEPWCLRIMNGNCKCKRTPPYPNPCSTCRLLQLYRLSFHRKMRKLWKVRLGMLQTIEDVSWNCLLAADLCFEKSDLTVCLKHRTANIVLDYFRVFKQFFEFEISHLPRTWQ